MIMWILTLLLPREDSSFIQKVLETNVSTKYKLIIKMHRLTTKTKLSKKEASFKMLRMQLRITKILE